MRPYGLRHLRDGQAADDLTQQVLTIARLLAVDDEGREQVIGEYTFNHTRSIHGPAAW